MIAILTPTEWKRRYIAQLIAGGGIPIKTAQQAADDAFEIAEEWMTPEDAAIEELSFWSTT